MNKAIERNAKRGDWLCGRPFKPNIKPDLRSADAELLFECGQRLERARFRRQVVPGETLELEVTMDRLSARAGKGHGTASVSGKTACEADLLFVIVDGGAA